ncbi:ribosomal protein S18-alanine N-acetyltransferase [Microbacterium sp. LRZ72]|uniref:ribosomal protein S18-alanine N-acetyltransferase n=1 Tax=Microbacterium sp. LRZ72 TaxID=2942481 RepID=UPI0029B33684|nr:ribosomal protein S18-alanine N-acetyltransferase [Microbacterium sp. LRZ72]MDX2377233.1 ribosomal protein S18-alanine N-acetyltransferase [Microbacterium sp. LRZ72]
MRLRTAEQADLPAIMALENASFPTDAWSEQMMRDELDSPHGRYLVADADDGSLVGYGGVRAPQGARDADIQTIALAESARGRGQGRMLLRALLHEAAGRLAREVFLEVRADNPVAQALYASEGFTEIGRRPRYYQPDGVDAVVMKLNLRAWLAAGTVHPGSDMSPASENSAPKHPTPGASPTPDTPGPAEPAEGSTG